MLLAVRRERADDRTPISWVDSVDPYRKCDRRNIRRPIEGVQAVFVGGDRNRVRSRWIGERSYARDFLERRRVVNDGVFRLVLHIVFRKRYVSGSGARAIDGRLLIANNLENRVILRWRVKRRSPTSPSLRRSAMTRTLCRSSRYDFGWATHTCVAYAASSSRALRSVLAYTSPPQNHRLHRTGRSVVRAPVPLNSARHGSLRHAVSRRTLL